VTARNFTVVPGFQYETEGADAVVRTLEDKLSETLSIKDFGAVGDDSTDNYSFLVAAINAAVTQKKILTIPEGRYRIKQRGSEINIIDSLTIKGTGGTIVWDFTEVVVGGGLIRPSGSSTELTLDNVFFDVVSNNQAFNSWFGLYFDIKSLIIRNCTFNRTSGTSLNLVQTGNNYVKSIEITGCYFKNTSGPWRSNDSTGTTSAITINNNIFDGSGVIGMNSPSGVLENVIISNNQVKNITGGGAIESDGGDFFTISSNCFESVDVAVKIEQFANRVSITGNIFKDITGPSDGAIQLRSSSGNAVVTGNSFTGNQKRSVQYKSTSVATLTVDWNTSSYSSPVRVYRAGPITGGVDEYELSPYDFSVTPGTSSTITALQGTFPAPFTYRIEQDTRPYCAVQLDDYDSFADGAQGIIITDNFIDSFASGIRLEKSVYGCVIDNNKIKNCGSAINCTQNTEYNYTGIVVGDNNVLSNVDYAVKGNICSKLGKFNYEEYDSFYLGTPNEANSINLANLCSLSNWTTELKGFAASGKIEPVTVATGRTGDLSSAGTRIINNISSTSGIVVGDIITNNAYVPANTVIIKISGSTLTLSNELTNPGSSVGESFDFKHPSPYLVRSGVNKVLILEQLPARIRGSMKVWSYQYASGSDRGQFFGEYEIFYDGTTLISQPLNTYATGEVGHNANTADEAFSIINNKLYFNIINNLSSSYYKFTFDFEGSLLYAASSNPYSSISPVKPFLNDSGKRVWTQTDTGSSVIQSPNSSNQVVVLDSVFGGLVQVSLPDPSPGSEFTVAVNTIGFAGCNLYVKSTSYQSIRYVSPSGGGTLITGTTLSAFPGNLSGVSYPVVRLSAVSSGEWTIDSTFPGINAIAPYWVLS